MNRFFWAVVVPVAAGAVAGALALTFCLIPASVPAQTHLFLYRWQSHCAPEPREQVCYLLAITIVCRLSIHSVQQWLESHNSGRLAFYAPGRINSSIDHQGSGSCAFLARGRHFSEYPTPQELRQN